MQPLILVLTSDKLRDRLKSNEQRTDRRFAEQLDFTEDGVKQIAQSAYEVNKTAENIGARRLHTIMERLLEDASFKAADEGLGGSTLKIDAAYVDDQLGALASDEDLSRFIL